MLANQIRRAATTLATQPVPAYTSTAKPMSRAIGRSPIVWTYLPQHLPYHLGLLLQETIVHTRLQAKKHLAEQPASSPVARLNSRDDDNSAVRRLAQTDVLLLLQHTPVYTAGRREKDPIIAAQEADRLGKLGADYISTLRGGQTTYHGPGQLVGYSLMDLEAADLSTRCYVGHLETFLEQLATSLGIQVYPLEHTGVFTSPHDKIASIGIHIRKRLSLHGFSFNIEEQTRPWFDAIVACGLHDVKSISAEAVWRARQQPAVQSSTSTPIIKVTDAVPLAVKLFGTQYGRDMHQLEDGDEYSELRRLIADGVAGNLPALDPNQLQ